VYRAGRVAPDAAQLDVSPDLVIEVLSPGSKALDLITKKGDYERQDVAEYWVLDPADASIRVWRREGERLVESACAGDRVPSSAVPGFVLDLRPIRRIVRGE
jgi:Uma2 family endonuclease